MGSALDVLAEWVGIEAEFVDALGQMHQTPPEKKRALLRAMDLPADSEEQAEATLQALAGDASTHPLPRCVVLYADKDLNVPVKLPQGAGAGRWRLVLEDGAERTGALPSTADHGAATGKGLGEQAPSQRLQLPHDLPWGYHRLRLEDSDAPECLVIVTPGRCWLPDEESPTVQRERFWGVAAQVYLLRSERNWGIGDFTDLARLMEIVREQGGDAVGVNPLHGMFPDLPNECSPYSPLSRYLLNALNIDVEAIPEFADAADAQAQVRTPEFQERLGRVRTASMVAYDEVAALKLPVLQAVFAHFDQAGSPERKAQFDAFQRDCDALVTASCVFAAIRQSLLTQDLGNRDCGRWPAALRHGQAEGVAAFREEHGDLVRYQLWLQWVADEQLAAAKKAGAGMAVGLYRDLAVGANPSGAEIWSNPGVMVGMAEVGAPPDILNTAGQNWVLPPFHPQRMREDGYQSFASLLRANMRHAGGLRIDHAMALQRLYWIPRGGTPRDGGYVRYPTDDLIGVIALESHRNQCLVVGEDLGTVPHGFRRRMAEANILSYKVLLLEEEEKGQGYVKGHTYQRLAISMASNHDLPTLRGWWEEVDLDLRERLGLFSPEAAKAVRDKRNSDREAMLEMFRDDGLLEGRSWPVTEEFIEAAHRFLAQTQAVLMMAQIEDIVEEAEQVNLPASMPDQYPSWSRRLPVTVDALATDARLLRFTQMANQERKSGAVQDGGPTRT